MKLKEVYLVYPSHSVDHEGTTIRNNTPRHLVVEVFESEDQKHRELTIRSCEDEEVSMIF